MADWVPVEGGELEYEVRGSDEPILLIHGAILADALTPLLSQPALAERYRLIHYHRRGYAGSAHASGPTSIARQAADCRDLLAHLGVERAHVVGHSFGGAVALQLALDTPAVVHSLALIEPGLMIGATAGEYREALARGGQRYRDVGAAIIVDEFLQARWPGYRDQLDQMAPEAFTQAVTDAQTWFETELPAQLAWHFAEAEARRITQPALSVLGGESEALWDRFGETHRWLLASLPRAEGCVVPQATHFPQFQNPTALAGALATFFARYPLPARS